LGSARNLKGTLGGPSWGGKAERDPRRRPLQRGLKKSRNELFEIKQVARGEMVYKRNKAMTKSFKLRRVREGVERRKKGTAKTSEAV